MAEQKLEAATIGFGTYKYAGTPNNLTFAEILAAAGLASIPEDVSGFDLYVVAGTAYYENDGTAADADCFPLDAGPSLHVRNASTPIHYGHFRFFAAAPVEFRISLWG